jgi:hypothetical protein
MANEKIDDTLLNELKNSITNEPKSHNSEADDNYITNTDKVDVNELKGNVTMRIDCVANAQKCNDENVVMSMFNKVELPVTELKETPIKVEQQSEEQQLEEQQLEEQQSEEQQLEEQQLEEQQLEQEEQKPDDISAITTESSSAIVPPTSSSIEEPKKKRVYKPRAKKTN